MTHVTESLVRSLLILVVVASATAVGAPLAAQAGASQAVNGYENLQVLPEDITRNELGDVMLGFLRSLGLPRRGGEGCLHCHSGDLELPRAEWDYASDEKSAKRTARRMVSMVHAINDEYLGSLEQRNVPDLTVGCATCHRGRVDPRPLRDVLDAAYTSNGAAGVTATYRRLHAEYFGSDAYDFRVGMLNGMASEIAGEGDYDAALEISATNEETHPDDPSARRFTLYLILQRALDTEGPEATLSLFNQMRTGEPPQVLTYALLDGLGWRTFRLDRADDALRLFRANRAAFPDLYFTMESLTEALFGAGEIDLAAAMQAYEDWLEDHPGHEMAQVQLTNLRRRR